MSKTYTAAFAQTPKTASAVTTAACASIASDAPTNVVELLTAGIDGAIVTAVSAIPRATITASSLLLFVSNDGGTTKRLRKSVLIPATTVSSTTAITSVDFGYSESAPLRLGAGDKLYVASQVAAASGIVFNADYTDY